MKLFTVDRLRTLSLCHMNNEYVYIYIYTCMYIYIYKIYQVIAIVPNQRDSVHTAMEKLLAVLNHLKESLPPNPYLYLTP
jgi:hypothetical protein